MSDAASEDYALRQQLRDWFGYLIERYGSAQNIALKSNIAGTTITRFMKRWESETIPSSRTLGKIEHGTGENFMAFCLGEARPRNEFERSALDALMEVPPEDREAVLRTIQAFARK